MTALSQNVTRQAQAGGLCKIVKLAWAYTARSGLKRERQAGTALEKLLVCNVKRVKSAGLLLFVKITTKPPHTAPVVWPP